MSAAWRDNPNAVQRQVRKLVGRGGSSAVLSRILHHVDRAVLEASRGRYTASSILSGMPIITLTTTGAKSGQPRSVPLIAVPDDDSLILVASNWGRPRRPAWYYNATANPDVAVSINGETAAWVARELTGEERAAAWEKATAMYPGYALYAQRNGGTEIPVLALRPLAPPDKEQ